MDSKLLAKLVRRDCLEMTSKAKASHIGSILSCVDIVAVLYAKVMNYDVHNPKSPSRDRFILSKGHAGACVYATLAEIGFFAKKKLDNYYLSDGTTLSGHVSSKFNPGVEFSTGSLGHGVSVGVGMALAGKMDKKNYKVFVVAGNGECNEGSIWEAMLVAAQHKLNNFTLIVDNNNMQALGNSEDILNMESFAEKFKAFGADVFVVDGHSHEELCDALKKQTSKPKVIIANTIKGKGVSFMENNIAFHYGYANNEQLEKALSEVGK